MPASVRAARAPSAPKPAVAIAPAKQPGAGREPGRSGVEAEDGPVQPQDRVDADLGHDREQGRHRRGRRRVGPGKPEAEREDRGLHREDDEEHQRGDADERGVVGRDARHADGQVGEVERPGHRVQQRDADEKQRRRREIDHDIVEAGAQPLRAAARARAGNTRRRAAPRRRRTG